jgi:hypothetical protein
LNAEELGVPPELPIQTSRGDWKQWPPASNKNIREHLWVDLDLPDDSRLAGRTLTIQIDLHVSYPEVARGEFEDHQLDTTHTATLTLATEKNTEIIYLLIAFGGGLSGVMLTMLISVGFVFWSITVRSNAVVREVVISNVTCKT